MRTLAIATLTFDFTDDSGVGRLAVGAIVSSDFPTAQGAIMILAIAFLMINLIVDVLYVYLDPRVQKS